MVGFSENELAKIKKTAETNADIPHLTSAWKRAYYRLADAADHLDAIIKRTVIQHASRSSES